MLRNTPMAPAGRAGRGGGGGRAEPRHLTIIFILLLLLLLFYNPFFLYAAEMDAPKQSAVFAVAQELIGNDTPAYQ